RNALALEMAPSDRVRDLPDPGFQGALEPVLMQVTVDSQERVLAQLAGIIGVPNHTIDDVPTQALMVADQRLECAARAGQDGGNEHAVGVYGLRRLARTYLPGVDDRWLPSTHPMIDTPNWASVASPNRRDRLQPGPAGPYLLSRPRAIPAGHRCEQDPYEFRHDDPDRPVCVYHLRHQGAARRAHAWQADRRQRLRGADPLSRAE